MRHRFALLSLAVVLVALPGLTPMPAAPAPKTKTPAVYALVYVGLGKNDPDNAKRIAIAVEGLRGYGTRHAVRNPKIKALRIVEAQDRKLEGIDRDDWAKSKTRVATLEGTAVVRVWFTDGSPEEQVLIVNDIVDSYVKSEQYRFRDALKEHEILKAQFKAMKERAGATVTKENERVFRRQEEAIKHLPHVIEWASLPEKP